ncbi:MAG: hypothetical protein IJT70_02295 [Clostridia bacterium]|nr:hypothetical protein [Clostridia bacterium]
MKRIISIILAALLIAACAFCIYGCGSEDTKPAETDAAPQTMAAPETQTAPDTTEEAELSSAPADDMTVSLDSGIKVKLGGAADEEIAKCGEPVDVYEAPSCIYDGNDCNYTFNGYLVTTSPDADGNEYVASVELITADAVLENGITIGSSLSDALAAFGDGYEESFGVYTYDFGEYTVSITAEADAIIALAYALKAE